MGENHIFYRLTIISLAVAVIMADALPVLCYKDPSVAYTYEIGGNLSSSVKVLIIGLVIAMFFIAFFSLYLRKCLDTSPDSEPLPIINNIRTRLNFPCGLERKVVESFPVFKYSDVKSLKIGDKGLECAVCISEFADTERLRFLPKCHHVFHPECIDAWLASHTTCPVCRADLSAADMAAELEFTRELTRLQNDDESNITEIETPNSNSIEIEEERPTPKFPRSHSTGHSLVSPGESCERYTLTLPEEVREKFGTLKRAKSCGCRIDGSLKTDDNNGGSLCIPERFCGGSDLPNFTVARKSDEAQSSSSAGFPV